MILPKYINTIMNMIHNQGIVGEQVEEESQT